MKFYEYMAKEVFSRYGIPVPRGRVITTPEEAAEACRELGPVAIKAQVLAGGRGKAGGIKFARQPAEAREAAMVLLMSKIGALPVEKLLVEQKLDIGRELYLGIAVDGSRRLPVLMASTHGGVNIEEVPEKDIFTFSIDIPWGLYPFEARQVAWRLGLQGPVARRLAELAVRLFRVFRDYDAELVEINPLVITGEEVIAADGRLNVDDEALYRHPDLPRVEEGTELEKKVKALGLSFVELEGDIAVMANGAGITMATLDILQQYGGRPANFLDAGGGAGVEPTARAIEVLLATKPRAILINIFGGITRCDDVARAIIQVKETRGIPVPMVIRLVGTNEEEGVRLLKEKGMEAFRDLPGAAAKAVELARQGGAA